LATGLKWQPALQHSIQVQFKDNGRLGQVKALAPLRVQFTHKTNRLFIQHDLSASSGVHGRMAAWHKPGMQRCQQSLNITLDIKEVDTLLLAAPLQRIGTAAGQASDPHGLIEAFNGGVTCS
jgi:hypothetical protein